MVKGPRALRYLVYPLFFLFVFLLFRYYSTDFLLLPAVSPVQPSTMSVTHTVLFQFKKEADPEAVKAAVQRFLNLKTECIHPTTKTPYLLSLKGGKDNSPEGLQDGITHGFVAEFATVEDRDYYVKTDPAHQAFVATLSDLVTKAVVVDFVNEVY